MKYRGYKRNLDKLTPCDAIRALNKEQIELAMVGCEFLGQVLIKLGLESSSNKRQLLFLKMQELNIDLSNLKVDSTRLKDLTGMEFGHLIVLCRAPTTPSGHTMWLCREKETGIEKPVASTHLVRGSVKAFTVKIAGSDHHQWNGVGEISGNTWNGILRGAKARKIEFSITKEYAWNLYLLQHRKCALSNEIIYFGATNKSPSTASLDRIDSTKGYVEGNVQWLHKDVNIMKNRFTQERFLQLCKSIAEKSNS
jgi:hypothetical protein